MRFFTTSRKRWQQANNYRIHIYEYFSWASWTRLAIRVIWYILWWIWLLKLMCSFFISVSYEKFRILSGEFEGGTTEENRNRWRRKDTNLKLTIIQQHNWVIINGITKMVGDWGRESLPNVPVLHISWTLLCVLWLFEFQAHVVISLETQIFSYFWLFICLHGLQHGYVYNMEHVVHHARYFSLRIRCRYRLRGSN